MRAKKFHSGDQVLHPMFGFGVVEGLTRRDQGGQATDYYGIRLTNGGVLSVPVARAETLGLRRVENGIAAIVACLHSAANPIPTDARLRIAELNARWHAVDSAALAEAVRDLAIYSHANRLTPADKKWLGSACDRLSVEAALVDGIEAADARNAIQQEVDQLISG